MKELDTDARYSVDGWNGIAFYIAGYPKVWEPFTFTDEDEEGNGIEVISDEGEWIEDRTSGKILVVMVGDDKKHLVDIDDLTPLCDEDYCSGCGQIGCTANG